MRPVMVKVVNLTLILLGISVVFSMVRTVVTTYNTMVSSQVAVQQGLNDLDSMYQRRYALVENLVEIVKETKGFEKFLIEVERGIYKEVAEAKAQATKMTLSAPNEAHQRIARESRMESLITQTLEKFLVLAQRFPVIPDPDVKDRTATVAALQELRTSLQELEADVQHHRKWLNDAVRVYNQNIRIFPANLFAKRWGFAELQGFEVMTPTAREDVRISF